MKAVQHFTDEYLEQCSRLKPAEVLAFIEEFRLLHASPSRSRLISMKVPEALLQAFRTKSRLHGIAYQTQIKKLMEAWLTGGLE